MVDPSSVLEISKVSKRFGDAEVLHQVSLQVMSHEVVGIVGQNGSGKSTLIKIIAGAYKPDGGRILLHGQPVRSHFPADMLRRGVATIYQELSLCNNLSVAENIFLPHMPKTRWGSIDDNRMWQEAGALFQQLGIPLNPKERVDRLSLLERQLVEIAKAVHRNPIVLILDEPTSALSQSEKEKLYQIVRNLREHASLIYISHFLDEVLELCERVIVLRDGYIVRDGPTSGLDRQQLVNEMVSDSIREFFPTYESAAVSSPSFIDVKNLSVNFTREPLFNASFTVGRGEIVALAGLAGSGAETLARAMAGLVPFTGSVTIDRDPCSLTGPRRALQAGISYVPNDRKSEGLVMTMDAYDNGSLSVLRRLKNRFGLITAKRVKSASERQLGEVMFRGNPDRPVAFLSGGNQQKVVFAKMVNRWLKPRILVLNDPTRGVDVGAKREFYDLVIRMARDGMAVLFVSSDLEEIVQLADRIYVFNNGRIIRELQHGITKRELQISIGQNIREREDSQ